MVNIYIYIWYIYIWFIYGKQGLGLMSQIKSNNHHPSRKGIHLRYLFWWCVSLIFNYWDINPKPWSMETATFEYSAATFWAWLPIETRHVFSPGWTWKSSWKSSVPRPTNPRLIIPSFSSYAIHPHDEFGSWNLQGSNIPAHPTKWGNGNITHDVHCWNS